jgi:hypothetical protein
MENEPREKSSEKATDREFADFLIRHIENPCEVEVEPGVKKNIREFYVRLAKEKIPEMTDREAIQDLEDTINQYK